MKHYMTSLGLILFTLAGSLAHAGQPRLVNPDGSLLGELCIAAAESMREMRALAARNNVAPLQLNALVCNGQTVGEFARQVRQAREANTNYVFSLRDESPAAQLCLAALRSDGSFEAIAEEHFPSERGLERKLHCNGMPLQQFVGRYRYLAEQASL